MGRQLARKIMTALEEQGSRPAAMLLACLFAATASLNAAAYAITRLADGDPLWVIDFPSFFMAADGVFNRGLSPYLAATRELYSEALGLPVLPFLYPPYALPALYPVSWLDYEWGVLALLAVNTAAAAIVFHQLHDMFIARLNSSAAYWSALLVLFLCGFVRETVSVGQVNLFAVIALLMAWRMLREGSRPVLAGALIGLAIVTKTYFALLLLLFLLRLEWRPVLGAMMTVLGFTILSLLTLPLSLWETWLVDVAPSGRYGTTPFPDLPFLLAGNQSVNSMLIRLFGDGRLAGSICTAVAAGFIAALVLALMRRRGDRKAAYFDATLPLMLVTIYLVAPLSWMHHLVFVLPAALLLWADAAERGAWREMALVGGCGLWIALPWPLPQLEDISIHLTLLPVPGILGLWIMTLRHALGEARGRQMAKVVQYPVAGAGGPG